MNVAAGTVALNVSHEGLVDGLINNYEKLPSSRKRTHIKTRV